MAKLTLIPIGDIASAAATIDANNARIVAAMEKTLFRDGTGPNEMNATLDMNDHRIYNLSDAIDGGDAVAFRQVSEIVNGVEGLTEAVAAAEAAQEAAEDAAVVAEEAAQDAQDAAASVNNKYDKTGGPINGEVKIVPTSGNAKLKLNKSASGLSNQIIGHTGEIPRWILNLGNDTLEAGANSGSNFNIARYDDDGNLLDYPLRVLRSDPSIRLVAPPTITTAKVDQDGILHASYISNIDMTGTSDASVGLQVALDAIHDRYLALGSGGEGRGGQLLLPEGGVFRVDTRLLFEGDCPITVRSPGGSRKGALMLQNASELLRFESDVAFAETNSRQNVTVDGLFIITSVPNSIALNVISPEMVKITNIKAYPLGTSAYWGSFFNGHNIRTSSFQDWYVFNAHSAEVQANLRGAAINLSATAGSTDNKYVNLLMQNFNVAWNAVTSTAPAIEGNHFLNCSVVGCNYGILWVSTHPTYVPPLVIYQNGHMHCFKAWAELSSVAQFNLSNCTLEMNGAFGDNTAGITGTNVTSAIISNNDMHFVNTTVARSAMVFAGASERIRIHDNAGILVASPAAVQLLTGTNNCSAHNNEFRSATAIISDSGTSNVTSVNNRVLT